MAHDNAWANHGLLAACSSFRATPNHVLVIDRFYVDAKKGGTLAPAACSDPEPCATVAVLRAAPSAIDRRLPAVAAPLAPGGLKEIVTVHRETRVQHERLDRRSLHGFQHQITKGRHMRC